MWMKPKSSWETWETTSEYDGNTVTCRRERLSTPSQLGPQERRNISLLKAWRDGRRDHDLMQCDAWRRAPHETRLLDHQKGDKSKPECCSRRVVQETRRTSRITHELRGGPEVVQLDKNDAESYCAGKAEDADTNTEKMEDVEDGGSLSDRSRRTKRKHESSRTGAQKSQGNRKSRAQV